MNDWIKIQKRIMFVPGVNFLNFYISYTFYKRVESNDLIAKKITNILPLGLVPMGIVAGILIKNFKNVPILYLLGQILLFYVVPVTIDYLILRTQCKHLNVGPEDIGSRFYKFLLLKKSDTNDVNKPNQEVTQEHAADLNTFSNESNQ